MQRKTLLLPEEIVVIDLLREAYNMFIELEVLHPHDQEEFMRAIHQAQLLILARPVVRTWEEEQEE